MDSEYHSNWALKSDSLQVSHCSCEGGGGGGGDPVPTALGVLGGAKPQSVH